MYDVIKASVNGESKLQQCLNLSCDKKKVARFVSCDLWNDKHALVSKAIAMFLQKDWGIRNAYKHGPTPVGFFGIYESVPGSGTTREQAPQGHKLPVLLPSPGCPVPGPIISKGVEPSHPTQWCATWQGKDLNPVTHHTHPTGLSCMQRLPPHALKGSK
jgi:hypothetical protein